VSKSSSNIETGPLRVGLISLGCAKNLVDAEIMLGSLMKGGIEITNDSAAADCLIVNTCSFIDAAQEESVDAILESATLRDAQNPRQGLIVSGCLPQRFRDELPTLLPEVDAFMGIDQVADVSNIIERAIQHRKTILDSASKPSREKKKILNRLSELKKSAPAHDHHHEDETAIALVSPSGSKKITLTAVPATSRPAAPVLEVTPRPKFIPDFDTPRFRLTPAHFAYVKIAEGCNHPCSFCIIPRMRGSHRSRQPADVVAEARQLLAQGVKELNLISQDSTYYGLDLRPSRSGSIAAPDRFTAATKALPASTPTLPALLRELNALPGRFWIRLLYTHPAHWTDELIQAIADCPKVARYIDMPLQHIHDNMLERMRRETSGDYIRNLIKRIRAGVPGIALRTTFIVGFPGETEAYFETLLDFIRETRFERLGIFTYSQEEGTRAGAMGQQISDKIKERRRALAMEAQRVVAREISGSLVGREMTVLVEKAANVRELASSQVHSWEHGFIRAEETERQKGTFLVARGEADAPDIDGRIYVRGRLPIGEFGRVKIIGHTDYDLVAKPL
jgi:ribosomal protein S12 methylthiotransferase